VGLRIERGSRIRPRGHVNGGAHLYQSWRGRSKLSAMASGGDGQEVREGGHGGAGITAFVNQYDFAGGSRSRGMRRGISGKARK